MLRSIPAALLLRCALPLLLAAALVAEEPPQPEVGFAGNYRPGPIPIRVPLANQQAGSANQQAGSASQQAGSASQQAGSASQQAGSASDGPDEEGDLVVEVNDFTGITHYVVHVDLPRGSKKSVVVLAQVASANFLATIVWNPSSGPPREIPATNAHSLGATDLLVVVACGDPLERGLVLPGIVGRSTGAGMSYGQSIDPSSLPDVSWALASVDLLYLRKVAERDLSAAQIEAIEAWVAGGGHLLLTGEPGVTMPFARLLPGTFRGRRTLLRFDAFSRIYGDAKPVPQEVTLLEPEAGAEVPCQEKEVPLVVTARRGAGRVTFLAFDPLADPFRSSPGLGVLWDAVLLRSHRRELPYEDKDFQREISDVLTARQGPSLVTVATGALVVVVFLVALWRVQRRVVAQPRRLAFAVFAAPGLAVGAACLAWVLGAFSRGGDRLDTIAFVEALPGSPRATIWSFDAFFHGGAGKFTEEAAAPRALCLSEVSPVFDPRRRVRFAWREEAAPQLADVDFYPNSGRTFLTLSEVAIGAGAVSDLEIGASGTKGQITNGTPWDWRDVRVVDASTEAYVGDVPRGGAVRGPVTLVRPLDQTPAPVEMARGGKLYQGIVELIRKEWRWPRPAAVGTPALDGDVLLVARIEGPALWASQEGRKEAREAILIVPLYGRDRRGGGK